MDYSLFDHFFLGYYFSLYNNEPYYSQQFVCLSFLSLSTKGSTFQYAFIYSYMFTKHLLCPRQLTKQLIIGTINREWTEKFLSWFHNRTQETETYTTAWKVGMHEGVPNLGQMWSKELAIKSILHAEAWSRF